MNYVQTYGRLVARFATKLTDNPQSREEFCQDAYMRIHQLTQAYPEASATQNQFWEKQVHVAVRNLMLDCARKNNRRRRYYAACDPEDRDLIAEYHDRTQNQFERLSVKNSLEELERLLPDVESRILKEMVDPSEDFKDYLLKKKAVQKIFSRGRGVKIRGTNPAISADPAIAEFFQLTPKEFRKHIENINFLVTRLI